MEEIIDVPDSLPTDLRLLATAVLKGDEFAVIPLVDCTLENFKGGARIDPPYVERLEEYALESKRVMKQFIATDFGVSEAVVRLSDVIELNRKLFNLEKEARQLGRFNLS